jgi:hypothetical protein
MPPAPVSGFHWSFGDGSRAVTAPQVFVRAWFSPFLRHRYCAAGTYELTVSASDSSGQSDSMTLPVHVYPTLQVRIVRHGRRATAVVSGGDGSVLSYRWTLPNGRVAYTRSVTAPARGKLRVTVSDAAGGIASAPAASGARSPRGACVATAKRARRRRLKGRHRRRSASFTG